MGTTSAAPSCAATPSARCRAEHTRPCLFPDILRRGPLLRLVLHRRHGIHGRWSGPPYLGQLDGALDQGRLDYVSARTSDGLRSSPQGNYAPARKLCVCRGKGGDFLRRCASREIDYCRCSRAPRRSYPVRRYRRSPTRRLRLPRRGGLPANLLVARRSEETDGFRGCSAFAHTELGKTVLAARR